MQRLLLFAVLFATAGDVAAQAIPDQSDGIRRTGDFVWYDLVTDDPTAAKRFYARMFGWEFSKGDDYSVIRSDGEYLGAIAYDPELDAQSADARWISSMSVEDVDKVVAAVRASGGTVIVEPENLKGRGRSAVVQDPQGAIFAVLRTTKGDPVPSKIITGDLLWNQLWTPDADASGDFYEKALGFGRRADFLQYYGATKALLVEFDWKDVDAHWLPLVLVPNIREAMGRVEALKGTIHVRPTRDFGDGKLALVADPTGGAFLMQEWED